MNQPGHFPFLGARLRCGFAGSHPVQSVRIRANTDSDLNQAGDSRNDGQKKLHRTRYLYEVHTAGREARRLGRDAAGARGGLFTKGRIIVRGKLVTRGKAKKADFVLYYKPNIPIALIEAKDNNHSVGHGIQQGLDYAGTLDIPFVFSSNGDGFLFHDRTGLSTPVEANLGLDAR
jgi:hypothetical protein